MDDQLKEMKNAEKIIKDLYGTQKSHKDYLVKYKELLSIKDIDNKNEFFSKLAKDIENKFKENYKTNFNEYFEKKLFIYIPWLRYSTEDLFLYLLKERNPLLTLSCISVFNENDQMILIDVFMKDCKNVSDFNFNNHNLSEKVCIYISNKLIQKDNMDEVLYYAFSKEVNLEKVLDYIIIKLNKGQIDDVNKLTKVINLFNYPLSNANLGFKALEENIELELICEFFKHAYITNSSTVTLLKILISNKKRKEILEILEYSPHLIKMNSEFVDVLINSKDYQLMLSFYKDHRIWLFHDRLTNEKNKLLIEIFKVNDEQIINNIINVSNYRFKNSFEQDMYIDYLIKNKKSLEIISLFLDQYNVENIDKTKLFKIIVELEQIDYLKIILNDMSENHLKTVYDMIGKIGCNLLGKNTSNELEYFLNILDFIKKKTNSFYTLSEDAEELNNEFAKVLEENTVVKSTNIILGSFLISKSSKKYSDESNLTVKKRTRKFLKK